MFIAIGSADTFSWYRKYRYFSQYQWSGADWPTGILGNFLVCSSYLCSLAAHFKKCNYCSSLSANGALHLSFPGKSCMCQRCRDKQIRYRVSRASFQSKLKPTTGSGNKITQTYAAKFARYAAAKLEMKKTILLFLEFSVF